MLSFLSGHVCMASSEPLSIYPFSLAMLGMAPQARTGGGVEPFAPPLGLSPLLPRFSPCRGRWYETADLLCPDPFYPAMACNCVCGRLPAGTCLAWRPPVPDAPLSSCAGRAALARYMPLPSAGLLAAYADVCHLHHHHHYRITPSYRNGSEIGMLHQVLISSDKIGRQVLSSHQYFGLISILFYSPVARGTETKHHHIPYTVQPVIQGC